MKTMALSCSICDNPKRQSIDAVLATGAVSLRNMASQFDVGYQSLNRHKQDGHIGRKLAGAIERAEVKEADEFLDHIRAMIAAGASGVEAGLKARAEIDDPALLYRMTPSFMTATLRAAELLGQATGRLNQVQANTSITQYLAVVLPRQVSGTVQPEQPVIDVTPDPEDK